MPRRLRIEYEGAMCHVMNRGDRREPIFRDDADRKRFLETLGEACAKTDWQVHALCLMGNPFHLVVETPKGNLVASMKWLLGTYTARFNRREFERQMETRRRQESSGEEWAAIRRGWFFGADALKQELLAHAWERVGARYHGAERQESGEAKAERLVPEELQKRGWTEAELMQRRKSDADKVRTAGRLRRETTMTLAWIAKRLHMGAWAHVSNLLRTAEKPRGGK